ncbi:CcdC family protein [Gorillibacterium sp. sgz5001074]|uniref:CcdC family protein n=1 Tax=Gorillibacterium sp. sgz5001074 TaxID=3446695 RepID=UPI003F677674
MTTAQQLGTMLIPLFAGIMVIFLRMRASGKPTNLRKIIIPPIGMSTGFMMFVAPQTRIPWTWGLTAFLAGAVLFSYPLIRSTRLELTDGIVYLQRSKAFLWIIIGMLAIRIALHDWVEQHITVVQTGAVFYLLAFGMILVWRAAMLKAFLNLTGGRIKG